MKADNWELLHHINRLDLEIFINQWLLLLITKRILKAAYHRKSYEEQIGTTYIKKEALGTDPSKHLQVCERYASIIVDVPYDVISISISVPGIT